MKTTLPALFYCIVISMTMGTASIAQCVGPYGQDPTKWERTFTEEFTGTNLNTSVWNNTIWYESPNPTINYTVENGLLKIWPQRDANGNFFNRTIDTDGKYYQTYGYFEADARLNIGKGCWPAFWLFNHIGSRRPEMDIMEAYPGGGPSSGWGDANLHPVAYAATVWEGGTPNNQLGFKMLATTDLSAAFHKYAVWWEPNKQTYYFDGTPILTVNCTFPDPMYLMLDLWFGSASGQPDNSTPTGKGNSYEINYVRAWKSGNCAATPPTPNVLCSPAQAPVIDGTEEVIWAGLKTDTAKNVYNLGGAISSQADLFSTYKATWDNSGLYLLVNVKDDILTNDSGTNTWDDDGLEVFIDGNNDKTGTYDANDRQYIFRVNDAAVYEYQGAVAQPINPTGVTFSQGSYVGGYLMEIKISWSALGVTAANGKQVGFDIHVNDDDDGSGEDAKLMWTAQAGQTPATDPSLFGIIKLDNTACNNVTGLGPEDENGDISIYPNPFRDKCFLKISQRIVLTDAQLKVYDLCGKSVKTVSVTSKELTINTAELREGIYFYSLINNGETLYTGKLAVQ